ncbi:MAG TPA: toxic anion resistance protein, partial [Spirochaetota bacterium]|nr:toxic anion resistance protein [Spirochaetota bacterium]
MEGAAQQLKNEVSINNLTGDQKLKVEQVMARIDVNDSQGIIQYGVGAQTNISNFADSILEQVKAKDAGEVGGVLTDLMLTVKKIDVDSLSNESMMSKIPLLGNLFAGAKKFVAQYQSIEHHIEEITDEMTKARMQLLKDVTLLDSLYEKNKEYLTELDIFILAGELKLKELQEKTLPEVKTKAEASKDTLDAQKVQDLSQMINRFEKKIYDLKLSRMIAIQTLPQVRLIQNNDQLLVEKIQSSIL